jgi:membrane-bound lytic murein transglycosylase D
MIALCGLAMLITGCAGLHSPTLPRPEPDEAQTFGPNPTPPVPRAAVPTPPVMRGATVAAEKTVSHQASAAPRSGTTAPEPPMPPHYDDLWQRIRAGFAMPELASPLVLEKERAYRARPEALQRMLSRGERYLFYIVAELEKRGMPTELALLPFVESAMNPSAVSSAKAAGLWQFVPATGRQFDLSQNWWVDNRRDVVKSTQAALDYLQKIYVMNQRDWFLALASYNWGENAVARAVKKNQAKGLPTDYLSLSMPEETRHYVPKLIALKQIILNAQEYRIALPKLPNQPYFATIQKTRPIDLKLAAQFARMRVDEFVALNPAHNRPVIAASRNNQIKLPSDKVDHFLKAMDDHARKATSPLASWQPYTLKAGETLEDVARHGNVSTAELLKANGLQAGKRLLPGTQFIAPQATVRDEMLIESFEGPRIYEQVKVPAVYHRVRRRETLATLATSYGVQIDQLRLWNGGRKAPRPGSTLLVRPAAMQTILTQSNGNRQVLGRTLIEPPSPAIKIAQTVPALRTRKAAVPAPLASAKQAVTARSARKGPGALRVVYRAPQNPPKRELIKARPTRATLRSTRT